MDLDRVCDCAVDMGGLGGERGEDGGPTYIPGNNCHIALIFMYVCWGMGGMCGRLSCSWKPMRMAGGNMILGVWHRAVQQCRELRRVAS